MLHKINLPDCVSSLEWIVQFQCNLLHALCDPDLAPDDVTVDWVKAVRPDVDAEWMGRFCGWSNNGRSLLDRMRAIVMLLPGDKQALIEHYEANLQFPDAFDAAKTHSKMTRTLPDGLSEDAVKAYRGFFEMFYSRVFTNEGFPVADGDAARFDRKKFLAGYERSNCDITVCPLCDGSMDGAQVDHWLAKKHLPELNCHPFNLVPICSACNSAANKGEKLVLDQDSGTPFDKWFHPYLRPAKGLFQIDTIDRSPRLVSDDPPTQARLDNLDHLVNLSCRWARKYDNLVTRIEERIRHHRRRGKNFNKASLLSQIADWIIDAESEKGLGEYKLLEVVLLRESEDETSDLFNEFLIYATDAG